MAQGEELEIPVQEELSIFDRVKQFGGNVLQTIDSGIDWVSDKVDGMSHSARVGACALGGALAFVGGGVGLESLIEGTADAASKVTHSSCMKNNKADVKVSYVNKAVLPLASEAVKAYHEARGSEVVVRRNQPEMYGMTYTHLTEVDINVPGTLTNGDSGGYSYTAQFLGRVTPKDLVFVDVDTYENKSIGVAHVKEGIYSFYIAKTTGSVEDPGQGLQWDMTHDYAKDVDSDDLVISKLADGFELPGFYTMTAPSVLTGTHQAEGVIKDMIAHRDITGQRNLDILERTVKICN
jgi:hypothetical protein